MNKASFGDLVNVHNEDGAIIGQGVVAGVPIANNVCGHYWVDASYGDGWSASGESQLRGVEPDNVELVESCWWHKWRRRVRR